LLASAVLLAITALGASAAEPFDQTLSLQGVSFRVQTDNASSVNRLTITPTGLKDDNHAIEVEADGTVTGAEVADLDANGSPEIYVYVTSAGSGSYGSLVAYAANNLKSLSQIYLPAIEESPRAAAGYMGHDEFAVVESSLVRRFPVYKAGDNNAAPSGGTRQLQHKLKAGEAGWLLVVDKVVEY
jgi:hypothetical protein